MRLPWTFLSVMVLFCTTTVGTANNNPGTPGISSSSAVTEAQIKERLSTIDLPMEIQQTDEVVRRIRQYVTAGRRETEAILGRTITFFPIFEHYLALHGLPAKLKYLPMIESGLRPTVKSGVGAAGMWQLMGITARHYGLDVNSQIDERFDPYKSTEAAVRMLSYLHGQFGDWALVLAAYNAGPGRIKNAMRYAGASNFEQVAPHLPKETQKYVPAFLAAAYIANFYHLHDLSPRIPTGFTEEIRVLTVQEALSFRDIAEVTGLSYRDIALLNPAYLQGYIPGSKKGNFLTLPASTMEKMRKYLMDRRKPVEVDGLVPTRYVVASGDRLEDIAELFHTSVEKIRAWNALGTNTVVFNQELTLFLSRAYLINRA